MRDRHSPGQDDRTDQEPTAGARPEIAASWRRSAGYGVRRDRLDVFDDGDSEPGEVGRAGRDVLGRLADDLKDVPASVMLADSRAGVLDRRVGANDLAVALDGLGLVPGSCWSENRVGTNAIGTAIVIERPVCVSGREHYADPLVVLASAAAPIRHPNTGRLLGAVSVACVADGPQPLLRPLAHLAAHDVERGLVDHSATLNRARRGSPSTRGQTRPALRRHRFGWKSLTAAELDVAAAVSDGLTNAEAARRLHVSPHTVDYHLRQIYRKLGIGSRARLASLVAVSTSTSGGPPIKLKTG